MASSVPITGYLYTVWGDEHCEEVEAAVASLRIADTEAHVTVVSDRHIEGFDEVVVRNDIRKGFAGKVDCLSNEYYAFTCYLDSDTYVCPDSNIRELFELLGWYDLCMAFGPGEVDVVQTGLTPYNTGVMLFGPDTDALFKKFAEHYNDPVMGPALLEGHPAGAVGTDQPAMALAIRDTNTRVHVLQNSWNAMHRFNISLMGRVKIIHGPPVDDYVFLQRAMNWGGGELGRGGRNGQRCWNGTKHDNNIKW